MVRNTLFLVAFYLYLLSLVASYAPARDFAAYRTEDGRMAVWLGQADGPSVQTEFHVDGKRYSWEGGATNVSLKPTDEGCEIIWKIDQIGPYWVYLEVVQNKDGISVYGHQDNGEWEDCRSFSSYQDLYDDRSDLSRMVLNMLERSGQNPILPSRRLIKTLINPPSTVPFEAEILVRLLDSDDPSFRQRVQKVLESYGEYWPAMLELPDLTIDQKMRIEALISEYEFNLPCEFAMFLLGEPTSKSTNSPVDAPSVSTNPEQE